MVCSMIKKGLLGAALAAGTLFLVFGTSAPSYVKTAFHKMRQTAKDSIDPRFEIDVRGTRSPAWSRPSIRTRRRWPSPKSRPSGFRRRSARSRPTSISRKPRSWP